MLNTLILSVKNIMHSDHEIETGGLDSRTKCYEYTNRPRPSFLCGIPAGRAGEVESLSSNCPQNAVGFN